jgi:hypothetical protein
MLNYLRIRLRQRIHSMILREFAQSGLSQVDLAARLGKPPRVIHRWLASPENLRLSTLSDLVFGICGGEPSDAIEHPLDAPQTNRTLPPWLADRLDGDRLHERTSSPAKNASTKANADVSYEFSAA